MAVLDLSKLDLNIQLNDKETLRDINGKGVLTGLTEISEIRSKKIIDGVFSFTYIQNRGMAWGMFQNKIPMFVIIYKPH